ncbi:hypothetical protein RJ639_017833 [Escallonia herrerae]|uniref:DNA polymerase III subunit gamma/tau n=1 Tax=Escallonia herrerae TaxID=1293975 RepID=A0AA88VGB2_9ASTE|nr:hypothetical protein RJ639_017833 [Escallonia herrerae]
MYAYGSYFTVAIRAALVWKSSHMVYLSLRLAQLPNTLTHSQTGLIPLLTSSGDGQGGSSFATGQSDDELSTNYGGLDLEALSRLDGRRWSSSCRSQEGLELVAVNRDGEEESMTESIRTLSQKYRPMFFEELIGQNIVVQSLMNAILRGRVAFLYLFQGPRGTGKTSTARVLAAALNCLASNKTKPCGVCRECSEFILGNVLRQLPYVGKARFEIHEAIRQCTRFEGKQYFLAEKGKLMIQETKREESFFE